MSTLPAEFRPFLPPPHSLVHAESEERAHPPAVTFFQRLGIRFRHPDRVLYDAYTFHLGLFVG